jgi:predicted nucleic acid-binding protein
VILVDSSVWIDHFRSPNLDLMILLDGQRVWCHPAIIGEVACGNLAERAEKLGLMSDLHRAPVAEDFEVLEFIALHKLMGRGVGYVDMQLLVSAAMLPGWIWTRDRRLTEVAERLGLSYQGVSG